jgi:hypothetical protein
MNIDLNTLTEKDVFMMKLKGESIFLGIIYYPRILQYYFEKLAEIGALKLGVGGGYIPQIEIEYQSLDSFGSIPTNHVIACNEIIFLGENGTIKQDEIRLLLKP